MTRGRTPRPSVPSMPGRSGVAPAKILIGNRSHPIGNFADGEKWQPGGDGRGEASPRWKQIVPAQLLTGSDVFRERRPRGSERHQSGQGSGVHAEGLSTLGAARAAGRLRCNYARFSLGFFSSVQDLAHRGRRSARGAGDLPARRHLKGSPSQRVMPCASQYQGRIGGKSPLGRRPKSNLLVKAWRSANEGSPVRALSTPAASYRPSRTPHGGRQ
jgi:hypothetical protein